jgi:hypothetical protein
MSTSVPELPFALDPLIAEAKRRARRRRYLAGVGLAATVAIAAGIAFGMRPGQPGRSSLSTPSYEQVPGDRLIVPGVSIAGIRFGTSRRDVAKTLGAVKPLSHDVVSYWGGRLEIVYSFHAVYTGRVQGLITHWPGFRTRSGVRIGSTRQDVRGLGAGCSDGSCGLGSGAPPDSPGTIFTLRAEKVAEIFVGST